MRSARVWIVSPNNPLFAGKMTRNSDPFEAFARALFLLNPPVRQSSSGFFIVFNFIDSFTHPR
jgi:hypothetical protein